MATSLASWPLYTQPTSPLKLTVPVGSVEAVKKGISTSLNFCCTSLSCRHKDMARAERCTKRVTTKLTWSALREVEPKDTAIDDYGLNRKSVLAMTWFGCSAGAACMLLAFLGLWAGGGGSIIGGLKYRNTLQKNLLN